MVVSTIPLISFEWDSRKELANLAKHGVSFVDAQGAFYDECRVIAEDLRHGTESEKRYFCYGRLGEGILTVRFTYRHGVVRIFGAGYWTRGKRIHEQENQVHKGPRGSHKDR